LSEEMVNTEITGPHGPRKKRAANPKAESEVKRAGEGFDGKSSKTGKAFNQTRPKCRRRKRGRQGERIRLSRYRNGKRGKKNLQWGPDTDEYPTE